MIQGLTHNQIHQMNQKHQMFYQKIQQPTKLWKKYQFEKTLILNLDKLPFTRVLKSILVVINRSHVPGNGEVA